MARDGDVVVGEGTGALVVRDWPAEPAPGWPARFRLTHLEPEIDEVTAHADGDAHGEAIDFLGTTAWETLKPGEHTFEVVSGGGDDVAATTVEVRPGSSITLALARDRVSGAAAPVLLLVDDTLRGISRPNLGGDVRGGARFVNAFGPLEGERSPIILALFQGSGGDQESLTAFGRIRAPVLADVPESPVLISWYDRRTRADRGLREQVPIAAGAITDFYLVPTRARGQVIFVGQAGDAAPVEVLELLEAVPD